MDLLTVIKNFLALRTQSTRRSYMLAVRDYQAFTLEAKAHLENPTNALAYIASLKSRKAPDGLPLADATIKQRYHALLSVFHLLLDASLVESNPFAKIKRALNLRSNAQKRPTPMVSYRPGQEITGKVAKRGFNLTCRDRALVYILFGCGLRRSELRNLNIHDVCIAPDKTMYLRLMNTKAGKHQEQPVPKWAEESVRALLRERFHQGSQGPDALFVFTYRNGKARKRLCVESIYRIYKRVMAAHGIKAAPHSARATAASRLKELGFEDREVARFLRHATTHMVEVYDKRRRSVSDNVGKYLEYKKKIS